MGGVPHTHANFQNLARSREAGLNTLMSPPSWDLSERYLITENLQDVLLGAGRVIGVCLLWGTAVTLGTEAKSDVGLDERISTLGQLGKGLGAAVSGFQTFSLVDSPLNSPRFLHNYRKVFIRKALSKPNKPTLFLDMNERVPGMGEKVVAEWGPGWLGFPPSALAGSHMGAPSCSTLQRPLETDLHLGLGRGLWWRCEFVTELLGFCGETLSPFRASVTSLIKGKLVLIDFHYVLQRSSSKRC